jgi:hypothetical protein
MSVSSNMLSHEAIKSLILHIKANEHRFRPVIAVSHNNTMWACVSWARQIVPYPCILVDINKTPAEIQADVEAGVYLEGVFRD